MTQPAAVIFDLDDTLTDTQGTILPLAEDAAVRAMLDAGLKSDFEQAWLVFRAIRDADPLRPFCDLLAARFGASDPKACVESGLRAFFTSETDALRLRKGARETLAALQSQGILLFLITFGVISTQRKKLQSLGIEGEFDEVRIISPQAGPEKIAVMRSLLEQTGLAPGQVWVVGDRLPGEIRAGNLLGMTTVRVEGGEFGALHPAGPEEVPDFTIRRLPELLSLLSPG